MMRVRTKSGVAAFAIVILLLTLNSGCSHPGSLSLLEDDALNREQGYESVVLWRVKVLDRTGEINSRPRLSIYRPGDAKQGEGRFDKPVLEPVTVKGDWTKQAGISVFENLTFAAAKPDEYLFKDIVFHLYTDSVPNYYTGRYEDRDVSFTVPLARSCIIPSGKLIYLGEILIEFLKEEKTGFAYRVSIIQEDADLNEAVKQFKEAYPGLYRRFNKTADKASWKLLFIENFNTNKYAWSVPSGDKYVYADIGGGKYVMQSKNDGCHWAGIAPFFDRPQNLDIELSSAGSSKADTLGHGLALGSDRENTYNFLVSGRDRAKVELFKNGDSQSEPIPWKDVVSGKTAGQVNRQKLEMRGDAIRYYLNDQYIGEIKNEFDGKDWFLGLAVCGKQSVEFDRLKIIEP